MAGVDVSIDEFKKLASQYHLGVNAYSFLITNNAKILYHPDYRPLFKDWLKPYYSSVDLNEVEMGEKTNEVRQTNADIQQIRSDMVSGKKGSKKVIIKTTLDSMVCFLLLCFFFYQSFFLSSETPCLPDPALHLR